jgi:hypothetical protein
LIDRGLQLDPDFDDGAIHGFLISYESARQERRAISPRAAVSILIGKWH